MSSSYEVTRERKGKEMQRKQQISAGKSPRLIQVPNDLLHRVTNILDQTQQKISIPTQLNRGSY